MSTTTLNRPGAAPTTNGRPSLSSLQAPRVDLYTTIHKALRHFMQDTLLRIGRVDADDADDLQACLAQLDGLLNMLRAHLSHENSFIHAAIEQRRTGATQRVRDDHDDHLETINDLAAEAQALTTANDREAAALRLHRHLALFVAENFEHMHVEETSNNALLWALFSDAELLDLHGRLLASIPMPEMTVAMRWMASALTVKELRDMLTGMQAGMPPQPFEGVLNLMQPHLSTQRWARLAAHLGVAQVPGLVAMAQQPQPPQHGHAA
jgi:hemerythrin-like domain-containing protein